MKLYIYSLFAFFLLSFSTSTNKSTNSDENWLVGEWKGIGYQIDDQQWEVQLTVLSAKKLKINYPSLNCHGKWKIVSKTDQVIYLTEILKKGDHHCDKGVEIKLEYKSSNLIMATYYLKTYSQEPIATAQLEKVK